ncbi:pseudouridine synthase [Sphaerotilus sp.]|uniref:pseudouridine synthase n=1 Tax=Sphaerotilus sp. TaxID=2093942 RepID=UPI00286E41AE|nr:pseudouridine synthase [Sphaerotilus sp.]
MSRARPVWSPPMREGVSASRVAVTPGPWSTVLVFLVHRLSTVSPEDWRERLGRGEVLDTQGRAVSADDACVIHSTLWYWRTLDTPEPRIPFELEILFQDAWLLAVDKPHFLPMTPKGRYVQETLLVRLKRLTGIETLVPMHRLDRETAGVVLFSVRPETRHAYQSMFRDRVIHKVYEAVAPWSDALAATLPLERRSRLAEREEAFMQMHEVPGEPNAVTRIDLIERHGPLARYRLTPQTGQKHQLRVHLNALGIPIVGDRIYPVLQPDLAPGAEPDYTEPLRLLAREIAFTDPVTGEPRRFASPRTLRLDDPTLTPSTA